jgi:hypothetical protein
MSKYIVLPTKIPKDMTQQEALEWEYQSQSAYLELTEPAKFVIFETRMRDIELQFREKGWDTSKLVRKSPSPEYLRAHNLKIAQINPPSVLPPVEIKAKENNDIPPIPEKKPIKRSRKIAESILTDSHETSPTPD